MLSLNFLSDFKLVLSLNFLSDFKLVFVLLTYLHTILVVLDCLEVVGKCFFELFDVFDVFDVLRYLVPDM